MVVTDHKALISLLNSNNKKNKTKFNRLTPWLDRLIPFDFNVKHKPGVKIGLADYLSRTSSKEATPTSTCDNMFTVAKINSIRTNLGFVQSNASSGPEIYNRTSKRQKIKAHNQQSIKRLKISSRFQPVEGVKSCERKLTKQNQTHGSNQRLCSIRENLDSAITQLEESRLNLNSDSNTHIEINRSMKKWEKILKQHLSLDSSTNEIEELSSSLHLEAITKETRSIKTNTTLSLPSAFKGEANPPVDPNTVCMSIVPRGYKIVSKITSLPELFNLQFIESNYVSDPQLSAIRELFITRDPKILEKILAMNRYYSRFVNNFYVKENVVWMDNKLVIPMNLQTAINNRIHAFHKGNSNKFDAAKDLWYPYFYRSIASIAENCPECTAAGKNLRPLLSKNQLGNISEPKEPNESVQLDFWGPIN